MIERSYDRIWLLYAGEYVLLGPGFTRVEEVCKTEILETPYVESALCKQEILRHTVHLEFEGYRLRVFDTARYSLLSRYLSRGSDATVTFVIGNRRDTLQMNHFSARRITGQVVLENPGTGSDPFGPKFKGKILYSTVEEGAFNENTKTFIPYN